jgi:polysaccharide export outer membrane protein
MKKQLFQWILLAAVSYGLSSCAWLNQSIMFKTPRGYSFDTPPDTVWKQYILQPNDQFVFRLFANDGFKLIDMTSMMGQGGNAQFLNPQFSPNYLIEFDGSVKLPVLGRVMLSGITVREAELILQEKYAQSFNDPFVQILVNNRRVIVYPGQAGQATVIPLSNINMTLIEALAEAGGMAEDGKAHRVKLFRRDLLSNKTEVYQFDLSRIEGLQYANLVVQTGDVIYVQPRRRVGSNLLRELSPWVALLTTALLALTTYQTIKNL